MKNAKSINDFSHGIRAFVGLLTFLCATKMNVFCIDEPEAFLHPPLAQSIGSYIGKKAIESRGSGTPFQAFAATHSSDFLMGLILSGARVDIIRLSYIQGKGTSKHLPNSKILSMMQDPYLRSASVLNGLFHNAVIITEADADRAFYQELNMRIAEFKSGSEISNALFINANGVHSLCNFLEPLRAIGIPAAAIADIDLLGDGGKNFAKILEACNVPKSRRVGFEVTRKAVWDLLLSSAKASLSQTDNCRDQSDGRQRIEVRNCIKSQGISLLTGGDLETANSLIKDLGSYGLFVVDVGQAEMWLPNLQINRGKNAWLKSIFEALGSDPKQPSYVKPKDNDVWLFLSQIAKWTADPNRLGAA